MGAYAILLNSTGQSQRATVYMKQAQDYGMYKVASVHNFHFFFFLKANFWMKTARDRNNYRLQYDLPNTWSQKYNLVYQSILSLNLFPDNVAKLESDYYQTKLLDFGIPLDSRGNLTKADWTSWIVALGDKQQVNTIFGLLYKFANESPDRVPFSDRYNAANGTYLRFRARSVMGGLFVRALIENPLVEHVYMRSKSPSKRYGRVNKCNSQ